ncbi:MAG TPA: hypothetical protein VLG11_02915 [Candidatus Saccharimonadales bacterium]|nr:hypothetical protein [Candidatus Saccharimonadales bacterium]
MSESAGANVPLVGPELRAPAEAEQRVVELLAMPAELVDVLRPQLRSIANQVAATALTPHEQAAIQLTTNILDWSFFGQPGDSLPTGLVFSDPTSRSGLGQRYNVVPDGRLRFGLSCLNAIRKQFDALGLKVIQEGVSEVIRDRREDICTNLRPRLVENPAYARLQAFDLCMPGKDKEESPLPPYWQAIRSTQLEHKARQTSEGMITGRVTAQDGHPYFAIRKIPMRIDNETMRIPQEEQSEDAARLRAREYFATAIVDTYFANAGKGEDRSAERRSFLIDDLTNRGSKCFLWDKVLHRDAFEDLVRDIPRGLDKKLAIDLLDQFAYDLFSEAPNTTQYSALLNLAVESVLSTTYLDILGNGNAADLIRSSLFNTPGEYVSAVELSAYKMGTADHTHSEASKAGFMDKTKLTEQLQQVVGQVVKGQVRGGRLIQSAVPDKELPATNPDAEVVIALPASIYLNSNPHIPGYRLVSRDNQNSLFGFAKDATDPYASALTPIPGAAKEHLAQRCEQIGLTQLGADLQNTPQLTVDGFIKLVRANSIYYMPDTQGLIAGSRAANMVGALQPNSLADFVQFVEGGKLLCQCTISDSFLQHTLGPIFGKANVRGIGGYYVDESGTIRAATHQQTAFTDGQTLHILDATPSSAELENLGVQYGGEYSSERFSLRALFKRRSSPTETPPPSTPDEADQAFTKADTPDRSKNLVNLAEAHTPEDGLAIALAALQEKSRTWLQLPAGADNETLYTHITKLSLDADPLRRTHDIALRARSGDVALEEIGRFAEYLANYKKSAAVRRDIQREFGVAPYPEHIIKSLENVAADIAYHLSSVS